ncbi:MAG TPA: ABC transporter ATP-binding protein [Patescibacteria group bacterium]|nr:ABC transporter ATP-binding protein [Patescibacteria group bacterium]
MIELSKVSKTYYLGETKVKAVDNVSLKIMPNEYLSILGSSGSGKSTLMYLIGLLESATFGKIYLNGQDISRMSDDKLSSLRNQTIGFVFQSFNLLNKLTVLENVMLPAAYLKSKANFDVKAKTMDLLNRFGLKDRQNFYPNKISGGQQQRVAIARALILNPKIILADEPTGNLDSRTGPEILKLIEDLRREFKTTIVMVTHEKDIAKRAQKRVYIKDGRVVKKYL